MRSKMFIVRLTSSKIAQILSRVRKIIDAELNRDGSF